MKFSLHLQPTKGDEQFSRHEYEDALELFLILEEFKPSLPCITLLKVKRII